MSRNFFIALTFLLFGHFSEAAPLQAMITSMQGQVEVLTQTNDSGNDQSKVIFEGKKYLYAKAKIGQMVTSGQVIRTSTDGKAKAIYKSGDVIVLGPSTAVSIPAEVQKNSKTETEMQMMYGKVRAIIDKNGPLTNIKVSTPSAVAGVRGTDLVVGYNPAIQQTDVHVLRGKVEVVKVVPEKALPAKSLSVLTGQKAEVSKTIADVKTSTKVDLANIQQETTVITEQKESVTLEVTQQVAELEKAAAEKIIEDINRTNPKVAAALKTQALASTDQINSAVVKDLYKDAPKGKPQSGDFNMKDEDVYKKYFDPILGK
ncbi:MAG: hypothetical protein BroJett040_13220 [Oligoflexia bacterium]|nr:MAG: hypothetical protein BroJett040_13220 [Oligoflexia bacterium]